MRTTTKTKITSTALLLCLLCVPLQAAEDITDPQVRRALESELFSAKGVSAHVIDITVTDGIVTLTGEVSNILAKERAVRIATMLKGVRSVVDHLSVAASTSSDEEIRTRLMAAIRNDAATDAWEIGADVEQGHVTLTGTVDSYAERELAQTVTKGVWGVRSVSNDIAVALDTDRVDSEIAKEIEARLNWDARLDGHLIDAQVNGGNVVLSGVVGSARERVLARTDAWVAGVRDVDSDELEIRWWARDDLPPARPWHGLGDEDIRRAVEDALAHDPRVLSFRPEVTVVDRVVTLRGSVSNVKARRAAAEDAANTVGVWKVDNHLKVASPIELADVLIADRVRAALQRDVIVHDDDIRVTVAHGDVRLQGEVPSYYAREQAESVASRVLGVTEIDNRLSVDYDVPLYTYSFHDWDPLLYDYDFDYKTVRVRPDWEIEADIERELWWSPFVELDEIEVEVSNGVATLTGTVDSWRERRSASENAIEGGAVKVVNRLRISGSDGKS